MKKMILSINLLLASFAHSGEIGHLSSELLISNNFKCVRNYIKEQKSAHNLAVKIKKVVEGKLEVKKNDLGLEDSVQKASIYMTWAGEGEAGELGTLVYKVSSSEEHYHTSYKYNLVKVIQSKSPNSVGDLPSAQLLMHKCSDTDGGR